MGYGYRQFLVDSQGVIVSLSNAVFERLLRSPEQNPMADLAGQRVRMASITVELKNRKPVQVVLRAYFLVSFDKDGCMDTTLFQAQQFALAEPSMSSVLGAPNRKDAVIDASPRFIAQGGKWRPDAAMAQRLDQAALGRM